MWPHRPTCHDLDPFSQLSTAPSWRDKKSDEQGSYGYPFRTCSFCGSMHPEDLVKALDDGAVLELAPMKYGWPHKLRVRGIPNPIAGQPQHVYTYINFLSAKEHQEGGWEMFRHHDHTTDRTYIQYRKLRHAYPAAEFVSAEFYSTHLQELGPDAFAKIGPALQRGTGITFSLDGGMLHYEVPHADA